MLYAIDIQDSEGDFLIVTLRDIMNVLSNPMRSMQWSLLHLWAVGDLPGDKTILDYESAAKASKDGIALSWEEMELLADYTSQIIDAVFVGDYTIQSVASVESRQGLYSKHDLTIEASDSTYWRVVSSDESLIKALRSYFRDVADVPEEELLTEGMD